MKKIAIIGPCLPHAQDSNSIIDSLDFLVPHFLMDYYDPLTFYDANASTEDFLAESRAHILSMADDYACFMGFSLGGMLLKKCMDDPRMKPCILFSTPTILNLQLRNTLSVIINLLNTGKYTAAMNVFNALVHYPADISSLDKYRGAPEAARERLIKGLTHVLSIGDLPSQEDPKKMLNFVGEVSQLINESHIASKENPCMKIVPQAGMRVLENNPHFCQPLILAFLEECGSCQQ